MALFIVRCPKCGWSSTREIEPDKVRPAKCPQCREPGVEHIRNKTGEKA